MNIYDFDNTIFKGDSSVKFVKYSFLKHPLIVSLSTIKALKEYIKGSNLGQIKSELFSFVKKIPNLEEYVTLFILKNKKNIKQFYLDRQREDDIIISASFDFIIIPFCQKIGIKNIIATKYDFRNGHIIGENCKGKEKIKRLKKEFPNIVVNEAYSDSLSDLPMFEIAKKAYLVKNNKLEEYIVKEN